MQIVLIVLSIIIFVSVIGLLVDVTLSFGLPANSGRITIKLYKIPIVTLKLNIQGNMLKLTRKKKPINFRLNKKNIKLIDLLKKNIIHRIYVTHLDVDIFVLFENPAISCLLSSSLMVVLSYVKYKINNFQTDSKIKTNVLTGFDGNNITILLDVGIAISLIDLVWAIIKTFFERRSWYGKEHRKFDY